MLLWYVITCGEAIQKMSGTSRAAICVVIRSWNAVYSANSGSIPMSVFAALNCCSALV